MLSVDGIPSENGIFQEVSQEVKNLQEDIKTGKFKNAYLLFGEEAYLKIQYKEKLIQKVLTRFATKTFLPAPVRAVYTSVQAIRYIVKGIHCLVFKRKLHVEVLDATAISVSLLRRDFNTAGSVMFLLGVGELLEEWTHKKSVGDLARSMSLNVEKVWKKVDGTEVFVPLSDVTAGDELTVHMVN